MSSNLFYRFRNLERILGGKELENQEIYFASTRQLNDPMEGFKNLIFNGDNITWHNLFKHYLLCLEHLYSYYLVAGEEDCNFAQNTIPVFKSYDDLPTEEYQKLFNEIHNEILTIYKIVIDKISKRTTNITLLELEMYLREFNIISLDIINKHYMLNKFIPQNDKRAKCEKNFNLEYTLKKIDIIEKLIKSKEEEKAFKDIFMEISSSFFMEIKFTTELNMKDMPNKAFMLNFPFHYVRAIKKLVSIRNYVACFSGEKAVNNSSLWGHYADGHKGVCLIFEFDEKKAIELTNAKAGYFKNKLNLKKINYQEYYPDIDFFRSIGNLPVGRLNKMWYMNGKEFSPIHNEIFNDENKWRIAYWNKMENNNLTKTKDWEYEDEYRLSLSSFSDKIDKEHRNLKYDFKSLNGIIFGINTPIDKKIEIYEIIKNKCLKEKREEFNFYQAYFSQNKKNIQFKEMRYKF